MAKLSIDRQPQRVPVESSASLRLRWTEQNAATQYIHALHPALLPGIPKALSLLIAESLREPQEASGSAAVRATVVRCRTPPLTGTRSRGNAHCGGTQSGSG